MAKHLQWAKRVQWAKPPPPPPTPAPYGEGGPLNTAGPIAPPIVIILTPVILPPEAPGGNG